MHTKGKRDCWTIKDFCIFQVGKKAFIKIRERFLKKRRFYLASV